MAKIGQPKSANITACLIMPNKTGCKSFHLPELKMFYTSKRPLIALFLLNMATDDDRTNFSHNYSQFLFLDNPSNLHL